MSIDVSAIESIFAELQTTKAKDGGFCPGAEKLNKAYRQLRALQESHKCTAKIDISAIIKTIEHVVKYGGNMKWLANKAKPQLSALKDGHQEMIEECRRLKDGIKLAINLMESDVVEPKEIMARTLAYFKILLFSPSAKVDEHPKEVHCPHCRILNPINSCHCWWCGNSFLTAPAIDNKQKEGM